MAVRKNSGTDFESRYFDLLNERSDRQDEKLEKILEQVRYTNGRVTKLEGTVYADEPQKKSDLPPIWRDPKFMQVAVFLSLALLLLVGYATKFDVGRFLGWE